MSRDRFDRGRKRFEARSVGSSRRRIGTALQDQDLVVTGSDNGSSRTPEETDLICLSVTNADHSGTRGLPCPSLPRPANGTATPASAHDRRAIYR